MSGRRKTPVYQDDTVSVYVVEETDIRISRIGGYQHVTGSLKPRTLIVQQGGRVLELDMLGQEIGVGDR